MECTDRRSLYTEKTVVTDDRYKPLAAPGGISPMSRTSWSWRNGLNKPEIVMEGGNVANHPVLQTTTTPDLSLISTSADLAESLEPFMQLVQPQHWLHVWQQKIKTVNPDLSLLSVRGMMVHSARWTEEMKRIGSINDIMSICGYGIPDEEIALFSK